jgi:Type IIA topoisomerase (DNA gyrase/topo II, topoisomerase IV), A subunit
VRSAKGHEIDPNTLSYRGDDSLQDFARGRSNQLAVFLDSNGKAYSIQSHSLPSARGMGEPITGRLNADSGVQFISSVIGVEDNKFLIMNTAGYGYISEYQNMISNKKTGRAFMKLPDNAKMLKAIPVKDNHTHIAAVSNIGKLLIFNIEELPILGKGKGNKIINIPKDKLASGEEFMAHAQLLADDSSLKIEVGKRSVTLKPKDWSEYVLSRAKRGKKVGKLINIERLIEEPKSLEEQ